MRTIRTSLFYLFFVFLLLSLLSGCESTAEQASSPNAGANVTEAAVALKNDSGQLKEIALGGLSPEYFAYNMSSNTLALITRKENIYTLHRLLADGTIQNTDLHWHVPDEHFLDNFVYGSDGTFYAVLKHYDKKGKTIQDLVKLSRKGTYRTAKLKSLNEVRRTKFDTYVKKKGSTADHSITDILFSGTALSVTYSNYAVKFYNIAEGFPLGDNSITASSGQSAFAHNIFVTTGFSENYSSSLYFYNIQSGEKIHSLLIKEDVLFVANYREILYLLTKSGLYRGSVETAEFEKKSDFASLGLPAGGRIDHFFAARDDKLYFVYQDNLAHFHVYTVDAGE